MSARPAKPKKVPLKKRILKSGLAIWLATLLLSLWIRFVYVSSRVRIVAPTSAEPYLNGEKPVLYCFWHGRLIMQPFMKPPHRRMYGLTSHHFDGALISRLARWFGVDTVRGSRSKGAKAALAAMLRVTRAGQNITITPDGPRGPFQKAAPGAAFMAIKTGYAILPLSFSSTRHTRLTSWDRFMVPKPFGRMVFVVGKPLQFGSENSEEAVAQATQVLEDALNRVTDEADRHCGVIA